MKEVRLYTTVKARFWPCLEPSFRPPSPGGLAWSACRDAAPTEFENNYFTEMCSGSEAGSYLRLIDFVYHSTLGLRVIKKKKVHSRKQVRGWFPLSS